MADAIPCLRYGVSVQTSTMNELQTPSEEPRHPHDTVAVARDGDVLRLLERSTQRLGAAPVVPVVRRQIRFRPNPVDPVQRAADRRRSWPGRNALLRERCLHASVDLGTERLHARRDVVAADPRTVSSARPRASSTRSWIPAASRAPRSSKRRAMSCSSSRSTGGVAGAEGSALSVGSTSRPSIAISKTRSGSSIPRR